MYRLVVILLLAGCPDRTREPAPCGAVASRFFTIALADLGKVPLDGELRRGAAEQLPALRDALAQVCERSGWSAQLRDCMVRAEDRLGYEACERLLSEDQRAALDEAAALETHSP
jgi:hypothetical protein